MAKKNGRDWTEWKEHVTGMHRLGNDWKKPHPDSRIKHHENTTASMVLPRGIRREEVDDRKIVRWIVIFLCALLARKCYFEMTKYERLRNETTVSRKK